MSRKVSLDWQPVSIIGARTNMTTYVYREDAVRCLGVEYRYDGKVWHQAWCADRESVYDNGRLVQLRDPVTGKVSYLTRDFGQEMFRLSVYVDGEFVESPWLSRNDFLAHVEVRYKQSEAKAWNKWVDEIKVGDFVKCKGQRSPKVWKKILVINDCTFVAMQYTAPIDDVKYVHGYSSETLIMNIKEKYAP